MTDVPSGGWREVYRWCSVPVSVEASEAVVSRGFDPPDSMSYNKELMQLLVRLFRSDDRRETYVGLLVLLVAMVGPMVYEYVQEQRGNQSSVRFEKIE